ncbi:hypothetical protein [Nitrosococcus watsonii]|uniref:Uncharacterized protein n=1 Tax=Nitrosococcus watsoni (strain C-113) TaxID=105559 RepID=D8KC96_NITWC|nr:hypothetical protein [Nitrosococcus watsonii]ADJ29767.1 conserved hypothetical protein [Nitrosococcus watsonii C-113]
MNLAILLKGACLLILAYGIVMLPAYLFQPYLLYLPNTPSRTVMGTPAQIGLTFETVTLTTEDGIVIKG